MDAEQAREWHAFEQEASRQLLAGEWTLRLSIMPSFSDWTVAGITFRNQVVVRRWLREEDSCKFATPVERLRHAAALRPTIMENATSIDAHAVASILNSLSALRTPLLPEEDSITLDGTGFEVLAQRGGHLHLCWNRLPHEWAPVKTWFDTVWEQLHTLATV